MHKRIKDIITKIVYVDIERVDIFDYLLENNKSSYFGQMKLNKNNVFCQKCAHYINSAIEAKVPYNTDIYINCYSCNKSICSHFKGNQIYCWECFFLSGENRWENIPIMSILTKLGQTILHLQDRNAELEAHIKYQPGGQGAKEAQSHFESLLASVSQNSPTID